MDRLTTSTCDEVLQRLQIADGGKSASQSSLFCLARSPMARRTAETQLVRRRHHEEGHPDVLLPSVDELRNQWLTQA